MRPAELPPLESQATRRFVDAVLALSDDPASRNVERYLVASRALESCRSKRKPKSRRGARPDERTT